MYKKFYRIRRGKCIEYFCIFFSIRFEYDKASKKKQKNFFLAMSIYSDSSHSKKLLESMLVSLTLHLKVFRKKIYL